MGRKKTIEGEAVVVSVAMPMELRDKLKEIAYSQQTDFPNLLRDVLRKFVASTEKKAASRKAG